MNKPKYQVTNRARKKMNKEIRTSKMTPTPKEMSNTTKPKAVLSRYPKKIEKKEKASLKSFEKNWASRQKKMKSPHSKRTTPGDLDIDMEEKQAAPRIVHIEGKRWIKTTETKIQANKKVAQRHRLKKK